MHSNKIIYISLVIIVVFLICCNNYTKVDSLQNNDEFNHIHPTEYSQANDFDSVKIIMHSHNDVEFILTASYSGSVHALNNNENIPLEEDYCKEILADIDTIFIKKLSPVIVSRAWHFIVKESIGELPIKFVFKIYSSGRVYKRYVNYRFNYGNYDIGYSITFERLAQNLQAYGGRNIFKYDSR